MKSIRYLLLLAVCCCVGGVFGRVFRGRAMEPGRLNTAGLGWVSAYQTSMNVNGVHNDLHVYSVDANFSAVDQLTAQFEEQGADVELQEIAGGYRGTASFNEQEARILILEPGAQPARMVFIFYPQPGKSIGPAEGPVPAFPGAMSEEVVSNDKTGAICRSMTTESGVAEVIAFYATTLAADGWATVLPSGVGASRLMLFQKGKQVCSVMAAENPNGLNRVTVLVNGDGF